MFLFFIPASFLLWWGMSIEASSLNAESTSDRRVLKVFQLLLIVIAIILIGLI